jgi:flagellar motility protein MotE (MotC chaperone)
VFFLTGAKASQATSNNSLKTGSSPNVLNKEVKEDISPEHHSIWSVKLVVLSLLIVAAGLLVGAQLAGWIDLRQLAAQIPGVERLISSGGTDSTPVVTGVSLMEKENLELKRKIQEQEDLLQGILGEKQALEQNKLALEQKIQDLEKKVTLMSSEQSLEENLDYQQLADYYAEMKPAAVVAIMDNLDDETVLGILKEMEFDQVAKILTAMQPDRAARLSTMFTTKTSS